MDDISNHGIYVLYIIYITIVYYLPNNANLRFINMSGGFVFLLGLLQNLLTVSRASSSPVVDTTNTAILDSSSK